ncbi:MAG TPA: MbnP family copper-binding protein [Terriglobales bacterium]|nr:MbnP family copper-binding protein [Terriglobales bacterium]
MIRLLTLSALLTLPAAVAAQPMPACLGDADADGGVTVDEILATVNNALTGCSLEPVTIPFRAVVGDAPFACGQSYDDIGLSHETIIPADLRFYLYDVRLLDAVGREVPVLLQQDGLWQYRDLVLLDFEDRTAPCNQGTVQTNAQIAGRVPPGTYRGLRFKVGVPFELNHIDVSTAPSPLSLTAMFWSWRAGYKFVRFDEARDLARFHVGSTACTGPNPATTLRCDRLNEAEVYLPDFDPSTDHVVADLKELFADTDLSVNHPDSAPGCESSPLDSDCDPLFRNLGINFANGMPDPSRQKFFRAESPSL